MRAQGKTPVMTTPYRAGTPATAIVADGWSRGFKPQQTVEELHIMGFTNATIQAVADMFEEYDHLYAEDMDELSQNRES